MVQVSENEFGLKEIKELVERGKALYDTLNDQYETIVMAMKDNKEILHLFFESPAPEITNAQLGALLSYIIFLKESIREGEKQFKD